MHIDERQPCCMCGGTFTVRALIEAADRYWPSLNVVYSRSPCCQSQQELSVHTNKIIRGYTYAAGEPHFCGMEEYDAPGIDLNSQSGNYFLRWENRTIPLAEVTVARRPDK